MVAKCYYPSVQNLSQNANDPNDRAETDALVAEQMSERIP
jgi:hypothetical protein